MVQTAPEARDVPLRVLVVASPGARATPAAGAWGDDVVVEAATPAAATARLGADGAVDCVVVEVTGDGSDVVEALAAARGDAALVVLSPADAPALTRAIARHGADDHLVGESIDDPAIGTAVRHAVRRRRYAAELGALAEAARREAERARTLSDAILETTAALIVVTDPEERFVAVNPAFARLVGRRREGLLRRTVAECSILPSGERERAVAALAAGLGPYENVVLDATGAAHTVIWRRAILRAADGQAELLVSAGLDVTAEREAEEALQASGEALRRSEARLLEAQATAGVGSFEHALDTDRRIWSPELYRILGLDPADGPRTTEEVARLVHPADRGTFVAFMGAAVRAAPPAPSEFRIERDNGEQRVVELRLRVETDADGRPVLVTGTAHDVTDKRRVEDRLRELADHDPLTGLLNRRRFGEELEAAVQRSRRPGGLAALLIIDLDDFKNVNDAVGHREGDRVLARLAAALGELLGPDDVLARLSGDEFGVILPGRGADGARQVGRALVAALRDVSASLGPRGDLRVGASGGATVFGAAGHAAPDELMLEAESALADAKAAGRGDVRLFAGEGRAGTGARRRVGWIERLRHALSGEEWTLLRQPIVPVAAGGDEPWGELLLRMREPDGRLIAPGAFLSVAERTDLVQSIDRWVVSQACELQAAGAGMLSVNLSARSVSEPGLEAWVERCLGETGADPTQLVFELTETAAIADLAAARRLAVRLRRMGCRFALDDFGAGFASFYYLKHLAVDVVKVDGEFVANLPRSTTDRRVVEAVVSLAHALELPVVAEWVGDEATVGVLAELGVDHAQGFHLGRPEPV